MVLKDNKIIPQNTKSNSDIIINFDFTDYITVLGNEELKSTFNFYEMLVLINEQMNNFSLNKKIELSCEDFEHLILNQFEYRPLYKIRDYTSYYDNGQKILKEIIDDKNHFI